MSPARAVMSDSPPDRGQELPRAFHRLWSPFWIAFVGWLWWMEVNQQLAGALPGEASGAHAVTAALAAAGHIVGNAIEALFYVAWWRARAIPIRFARLFESLVSISVLDLLAASLTHVAEAHPGWIASALEVFVGFGALRGDPPGIGSGLRVAFGSVGLLCVARLIATAAVQRQATGKRLVAPLALTFAVWLICRIANWWTFDLVRGMSPLS